MKKSAFWFCCLICSFGAKYAFASGSVIDVQNVTRGDLATIIRNNAGASKINITNSSLILRPNINTYGAQIVINSSVLFLVEGVNKTGDTVLLQNIVQNGMPIVNIENIDPMYVSVPNISSNSISVHTVRQTNYSVVFGGGLGAYLDAGRANNPNDNLLIALDSATNRNELNRIVRSSARLNPGKLMDSVSSMNSLMTSDWASGGKSGLGLKPLYVYSKEYSVMGANVNFAFDISKYLHGTIGGQFGKIEYSDKYDDWSGNVYGGNIGLLYQDNSIYFKTVGVFSSVNFDGPNVYDGTELGAKPKGTNGFLVVDGGPVFVFMNGAASIIPFVGGSVEYTKVLKNTTTDFLARAGMNIGVGSRVDGNRYGYGLRAWAQTNGDIYGGLYTDMFSTVDGIGGQLNFGVLHNNDTGTSFRLSIDAKLGF
ncbi:MAG: hypothetical protein K5912_02865 [Alphaproteobacteria bacterium]|nr:hypothetical protein [Alphaproteobacteria bacterium]